jgi:hypothetical protein
VTKEVERPLLLAIDDVAREVMKQYYPAPREMLPMLAQA